MPNASTQTVSCVECQEDLSTWWDDAEGDHYCADCFQSTGESCGGCAHEECHLCQEHEEDDSDSEEEDAGPRGSFGGLICDICEEARWTSRLIGSNGQGHCYVCQGCVPIMTDDGTYVEEGEDPQ